MVLTKKHIAEFMAIFQKRFNKNYFKTGLFFYKSNKIACFTIEFSTISLFHYEKIKFILIHAFLIHLEKRNSLHLHLKVFVT